MAVATTIQEEVIKQQILQAAKRLFQQHGYQKVAMDDVAKAIGKGRSSLYYYYKNKDEIFDAVMDMEIAAFAAELSHAIELPATTESKIFAFCIAKINAARKRKDSFNAMESGMDASEMSLYARKLRTIHQRLMQEESKLLHSVISSGIKSKELPPLGDKELETAVYVLLCSIHGIKREMLQENDYSRMETVFSTLAAMTIKGIKK